MTSEKKTGKPDQIQKLLQLEEKKLSILEAKAKKQQEHVQERNKNHEIDEDSKFFESLKPHLKLITGMNKLLFRNDVQNLVMKYAYNRGEFESSRSVSGLSCVSDSRASSSVQSVGEGSYTLFNLGHVTGAESGVDNVWSDNLQLHIPK